jgi:hypothetical protein
VRVENSFIPVEGVGETTERRLWRAGVTTWGEFHPEVDVRSVGPTTAERIERFVDEARTHLASDDTGFFADCLPSGETWRLYEDYRDRACFFDIETTGLSEHRDRVTTVSFHQGGETETLVRGRDLNAEILRKRFADAPLIVTYNGRQFDVPFLETAFDLSIDTPHLDLISPCRRVGLTGGLSAVEHELGIGRDRPDISGRDAVRLWRRYERRGDRGALEDLVEYNREDTVNMLTVADAVTERLHREVFERAREDADAVQ